MHSVYSWANYKQLTQQIRRQRSYASALVDKDGMADAVADDENGLGGRETRCPAMWFASWKCIKLAGWRSSFHTPRMVDDGRI